MSDDLHLRLAGVTRLRVTGRRPRDVFVFDPHRLALPCWTLALGEGPPATLLTFDRHLDLVPPVVDIPLRGSVQELDELARWKLDVRNVDHILAAMEAGLIDDVIAVARSTPRGALGPGEWRDRRGQLHRITVAPTLERLLSHERDSVERLLGAPRVLLDIDLDCFTTPSDADPTDLLVWPRALIAAHLFPPDAAPFWERLLPHCIALTLAREPHHCGGLIAANALFADAAEVIFRQLLDADLP